jgi:hypothetical protein
MPDSRPVLFVCESYYLKFYRPLAAHLAEAGFRPIWVVVDRPAEWEHEYLNPAAEIEELATTRGVTCGPEQLDALTVFERIVFETPKLFKENYGYTINIVRSTERARQLADSWYEATLALLERFRPAAVFLWNGRYLPYSAVSAACQGVSQAFFTSEIGWVPGTIFLDYGTLSTHTTDLAGQQFESFRNADRRRADAFLEEYVARKATMVSQTIAGASEVRRGLLGSEGRFLVLYGCQVDWDTNVVIGARRFHSNESAIGFLLESLSDVPGARLVVKTHPLDPEKKDDRLQRLLGDRGAVVADVHPHTLIEAADCVVVRNSTLGFEALCYGKPVMLLEHAKYRHPNLTLDASDVASARSNLMTVSNGECRTPDPDVLRQFVIHLLDRYLVPGRYDYHFERTKLEILAHFEQNQSHQYLVRLLNNATPPLAAARDQTVSRAIARCELRRFSPLSFWSRQARRILQRLS